MKQPVKSNLVRQMIKEAVLDPKAIAEKAGCSLQYVYDLKSRINAEEGRLSTRGRKRRVTKAAPAAPTPTLPPPSISAKHLIELRDSEISNLKSEINDLTAVIAYLEYRLKQHGAAI